MFSRIDLTNFRAIGAERMSVPLKPLTILVGENGSGKPVCFRR
jgi:predicted ATPase